MDLAVHVEMFFMFHVFPSTSFHPLLSASITIYFMPTQRNTIKTYRNKYDCVTLQRKICAVLVFLQKPQAVQHRQKYAYLPSWTGTFTALCLILVMLSLVMGTSACEQLVHCHCMIAEQATVQPAIKRSSDQLPSYHGYHQTKEQMKPYKQRNWATDTVTQANILRTRCSDTSKQTQKQTWHSHTIPRSLRYTGLSMTRCPPWIIWATVSLNT